ncbi:hypothetical protein Y032_0173g409 [Ancylostoma ceylanicum]|uniref:Uncharacterized protein n=1 Tax=Ancylostoma ceylanicum TaxID=53326 RepID=A0A016SUU3_9BILA|nr:hypothetical protein Y032_0173g409 [Ancylostoma ceylanicum]
MGSSTESPLSEKDSNRHCSLRCALSFESRSIFTYAKRSFHISRVFCLSLDFMTIWVWLFKRIIPLVLCWIREVKIFNTRFRLQVIL